MTKRRAVKRSKAKPAKVRKIALPPTGVLQVAVPKGHVPIVAADLSKGVVEIVPVKRTKKTWWQSVFG